MRPIIKIDLPISRQLKTKRQRDWTLSEVGYHAHARPQELEKRASIEERQQNVGLIQKPELKGHKDLATVGACPPEDWNGREWFSRRRLAYNADHRDGTVSKRKKTHLSHFLKPICRDDPGRDGIGNWQISMHVEQVDCKNCIRKLKEKKYISEDKFMIFSFIILFCTIGIIILIGSL